MSLKHIGDRIIGCRNYRSYLFAHRYDRSLIRQKQQAGAGSLPSVAAADLGESEEDRRRANSLNAPQIQSSNPSVKSLIVMVFVNGYLISVRRIYDNQLSK